VTWHGFSNTPSMTNEKRNIETSASYALLDEPFPQGCRLDRDEDAPYLYAVWCPVGDGQEDIIGAANDPDEAIAEARVVVQLWKNAEKNLA